MAKQIQLIAAAALTLALQTGAIAQTTALPTTAAQDVQGLAPQLVAFAGSNANFQSLVNGLSQGSPVTLTTVTADGFFQTVTFTPASSMSSVDIARMLETARQQLIGRGVANPTAQQIGVTMAGGSLPTPSGTTQVSGSVTTVTPGGFQPSASTGASLRTPPAPRFGTTNPPGNLVIDIRPTATLPQGTGTTPATPPTTTSGTIPTTNPGTTPTTIPATTTPTTSPGTTAGVVPQPSGLVRFTSDSGRTSNTSDTLAPSAPLPTMPPLSSPGTAGNGGSSPAEQLQRRR